jgi:hypothetical protein
VYPHGPNKKPSWLEKYNFACFLNLVEVIRRCRPLRNLWEGGYQGEGNLRKTKGTLSNRLQKNWQVNSMASPPIQLLCPEIAILSLLAETSEFLE